MSRAISYCLVLALQTRADNAGYNEQDTLFRQESEIVNCLVPVFHTLGVPNNRIGTPIPTDHTADLPHGWYVYHDRHDHRKSTKVTFTAIYYVDGQSVSGTSVTSDKPVDDRGWSSLYTTDDTAIVQQVDDEMTLVETSSDSYTADVSFSITNRTSVSVSGGVAGVGEASAENETTVSASSSFGLNSASERQSTYTHHVQTTLDIPPHTKVLATVDVVERTVINSGH